MTNPNENCLEGKRCPKCGSYGPFAIRGTAWFEVDDDGSTEFEDLEYDAHCLTMCRQCQYSSSYGNFDDPETKEKKPDAPEETNSKAGTETEGA